MTLRDHILSAASALTPGQRDLFTWIVLGLAVVLGLGLIGVVFELEGDLWKK